MNEDWNPPIGIPRPTFGITGEVTMYLNTGYTYDYSDDGVTGAVPYRVAHGLPYTYYVNRLHTGATNTNNPHGSPDRPRTSWPYPLNSGDVVQLHGTGYNFSNAPSASMAFGGTGSFEKPIFLTSTGAIGDTGNYPTINRGAAGQSMYIYGNYTIVEKMRMVNDTTFNTRPLLKGAPALYVVVRDCLFDGNNDTSAGTAISTGGSSGNSEENYTDNLVVLKCEMKNLGDWTRFDLEIDACGCIFSENATNCWMLDCDAHHINGDGVRLGADQGGTASGGNYYVGRCRFHHNKENGVDIKQADNAVISECEMHTFSEESETSAGEAIVIHYDPSNIWFINNIIHDCRRGLVSSGAADGHIYIIGNVWYNLSDYAIYIDRAGGLFHVMNNVIHNCVAGGIVSTGIINLIDIHGNIIYDITTGDYLHIESTALVNGTQVETATAEGTITGSGDATVIVTGADIVGSPITFNVAVLSGDTAATWAGKVRTALSASAAITNLYTVGGTGASISFTRIVAAANDDTLNISLDNGTCTGIVAALTSNITIYGNPVGTDRASHELYFESAGNATIRWGGATYNSVASWISSTTSGDESLEEDPLFVDADNANYRLTAASPARNRGYDLSAIDATFQSHFGVSMLRDIDGVVRPQGGVFDMGAYEFLQSLNLTARLARIRSTNATRITFS